MRDRIGRISGRMIPPTKLANDDGGTDCTIEDTKLGRLGNQLLYHYQGK